MLETYTGRFFIIMAFVFLEAIKDGLKIVLYLTCPQSFLSPKLHFPAARVMKMAGNEPRSTLTM